MTRVVRGGSSSARDEPREAVDLTDPTSSAEAIVWAGLDGLRAAVGVEIGPGDWLAIDQPRVDGFADDTLDHQWIHVDPERAAQGPYGGPVAHGFLTLSLIPYLINRLRRIEGARLGINYGLDKVRFPAPVVVGSRIRARCTLTSLEPVGDDGVQIVTHVEIEVEGSAKPACVAHLVARYSFAAS